MPQRVLATFGYEIRRVEEHLVAVSGQSSILRGVPARGQGDLGQSSVYGFRLCDRAVTATVVGGYVQFDPTEAAVCYAVIVDNATNDGRFLAATEYKP